MDIIYCYPLIALILARLLHDSYCYFSFHLLYKMLLLAISGFCYIACCVRLNRDKTYSFDSLFIAVVYIQLTILCSLLFYAIMYFFTLLTLDNAMHFTTFIYVFHYRNALNFSVFLHVC